MKRFFRDCGCGGLPECRACKGSGRVPDREAELEYVDYCRDRDKDEALERKARGER